MFEKFKLVLVGKKYYTLKNINEQAKYLTLNFVFIIGIVPLVLMGINLIGIDPIRMIMDFIFSGFLFVNIFLLRSKIPHKVLSTVSVTLFGTYFLYLLSLGTVNFWVSDSFWGIFFPLIAIFLLQLKLGLVESTVYLTVAVFLMFVKNPYGSFGIDTSSRYLSGYFLCMGLTIVYEVISMIKDRKEQELKKELAEDNDMIQTMKDNLHQGIFLLNKDLQILPQYSKPLISILSHYDSDLEGKNFLDILTGSLDSKQLKAIKIYFRMVFQKEKDLAVLEEANPISEFEYKVDGRSKILKTRFNAIDYKSDTVVIGILQDITVEYEFKEEIKTQKAKQEVEIKNMFDVIQIDPIVFQDFIEDTEENFNYINSLLKDQNLTERQVVTRFFQTVHGIKSNALTLGLESFSTQLHELEDDIKRVLDQADVTIDNVFNMTLKLEEIMREKDYYISILNKIKNFKETHRLDTILLHSLTKAMQKISTDLGKKAEIEVHELDTEILKTNLRKPIKDILHQCVRNSMYHGIDLPEERKKKHKQPTGHLTFDLKKADDKVELIFSDDGNGLDWDKISHKYMQLYPGKTPDRKALLHSIFSPEFSTSDEVSQIAGRGIGLSLVKELVQSRKGSIKVDSTDKGLTFKFIFPNPGIS